jgi:hypothetical protein
MVTTISVPGASCRTRNQSESDVCLPTLPGPNDAVLYLLPGAPLRARWPEPQDRPSNESLHRGERQSGSYRQAINVSESGDFISVTRGSNASESLGDVLARLMKRPYASGGCSILRS